MNKKVSKTILFFLISNFLGSWETLRGLDISLPAGVIKATKDGNGKLPSELLTELFEDYRSQNFQSASQITTGKMAQAVMSLYEIQKKSGGRLPENLTAFYSQLSGMKVLGEYQYHDSSIVRIFWILHIPEKYNKNIFFTKIHCIDYYLKKNPTQKLWKIDDAKFLREYIFYNKAPQF